MERPIVFAVTGLSMSSLIQTAYPPAFYREWSKSASGVELMRLIKVKVPKGMGSRVKETAFDTGIGTVSIYPTTNYNRNGEIQEQEVVDIETSTPKVKNFVDRLLAADYYDKRSVSFNVRQPRTIGSSEDIRELTTPLAEPSTDLFQELWQFSRVTYGLLGRVLIAAALIAYG